MREVYEFAELATYNAEVVRGLMHTAEYQRRMAAEQDRFNTARLARLKADGFTDRGNDIWVRTTSKPAAAVVDVVATMNHWIVAIAIVAIVSFALTGGIARWLGMLVVTDAETQTWGDGPADVYETSCILCHRYLPDHQLEYVVSSKPEQWCVDLTACKAFRDTQIGATS